MRTRTLALVVLALAAACGGSSEGDHEAHDDPSCPRTGASARLVARELKFAQTCLTVPAGKALAVTLANEDKDVEHNLTVATKHDDPNPIFRGQIVGGPSTTEYTVPALKKGTWHFHCDVHPDTMKGTLKVS